MTIEKATLLVVEDNDADFRLVTEYLKESPDISFEVTRATRLSDAIKMIAEKQFDAALLDLGLPDSTGLRNIDKFCSHNSRIAILVLTGMDDEKLGIEAVKKGAQDYLVKGSMHGGLLYRSIRYAIERKQAENKIIHLASFPNNDPDPIIEIDTNGEVVFSNKSVIKILDEKGVLPKINLFFPEDFNQILKTLYSGEKKEYSREVNIKGSFFLESISVLPELQVVRIHAHEITKRKRAELELRQSEERLRRFYESGMVGVMYWNMDGLITDANDKFLEMTGFTKEDLVTGKLNWVTMTPPEYRYLDDESVKELKAAGVNKNSFEKEYIRKDGTRIPVVVAGATLHQESLNGVSFVLDITERKRAEAILRKDEEELKKLNRTLKAGGDSNQAMMRAQNEEDFLNEVCKIIVKDCGYSMVWIGYVQEDGAKTVRPVAQAGYEEGYLKAIHVTWDDTERGQGPTGTAIRTSKLVICRNMLTDPNFKPWREEATKRGYTSSIAFPVIAEGKVLGAITIYSKDPDPFTPKEVELLSELANDLAYGITAMRLRTENVKAREVLEKDKEAIEKQVAERTEELLKTRLELEKSKRLSDVGVLAATVAHELRNPLSAIMITVANMQRKVKDAALFERYFQTIKKKVSESNQIINNLLFYSRLRKPNLKNVEVDPILEECVDWAQRQAKGKIIFMKRWDPIKNILIEADALQIQEVFMNLLSNACDAVATKQGRIEIMADHDTHSLRVCIKDNGVGIGKDILERIFDPFFTTKAKGTGLGLTVCYQMIKMHGGSIGFTSEPGQGTTVEVILPKQGIKND